MKGKWARINKARGRRAPGSMNKTEQAYARLLNARQMAGEILEWGYEKITLRLAKGSTFTPDFFVVAADMVLELHEVKGQRGWKLDDEGRTKFKISAELFPFLRIKAAVKKKDGGWAIEIYEPRGAFPRVAS